MYYSFMVDIGISLFIPLMLTRNFTNKHVLKMTYIRVYLFGNMSSYGAATYES